MPIPVTIPRLGWNMEEGVFVEWLKADGESVRPGEVIFRLEGEKATEDVECLDAGILRIHPGGPKPGDRLAVGAVIGYLVQPGEDAPSLEQARVTGPAPVVESRMVQHAEQVVRDVSRRSRPAITPRARRLAARLGINPENVHGTGRGGRIRERDIASGPRSLIEPLSPIRRAIAERMVESRRTTAPVTLTSLVDASNLVALRKQLNSREEPAVSFTDLFVKLAAAALERHPALAARWSENGIVPAASIDIGIAVDADAGLFVPVIRDVPALTIRQVAARSRELAARARSGTIAAAEMRGGSFTVTNLGAYGIDAFTPIINPPECAVLGVGRIRRQPVMEGDRLEAREMVTLSLTFDHRLVDGAPAARFLQTLARSVEDPGPPLSSRRGNDEV